MGQSLVLGAGAGARPGGKGRWAWSTRAVPQGAVSLPEARPGPSRTHRSPERGSTSLSQARKQSSERFKPMQRRRRLGAHSWAYAPPWPHLSHPHAATSGGVLLRGCPVWSGRVARTPGRASGLVKPRADGVGLSHTGSRLQLGLGQGAQGCWRACLGAGAPGGVSGHPGCARARLPTCVCFDNPGSLRSLSSHVRQPPL